MNKGISVIICCYNSELRLPKTLEHIAFQQVKENLDWEVIIVDNNSSDNTGQIALSEWCRYNLTTPLKVIEEPVPGLSNARRKGVTEAKYDCILFCDDDNWLDSTYVENTYKILISNPSIGAIGGQGFPISDQNLPDWFYNYIDSYACGPQAEKSGYVTYSRNYLYGAGLAFRTNILLEIYQNDKFKLSGRKGLALTSGEDSELTMNVVLKGYELYYDEKLTFKHYIPSNRISIEYIERLHRAFGEAHYHLFPKQLQINNKLQQTPKFPFKYLATLFMNNLRNLAFFLFTKKHFSGTIKGAWTWGVLLEYKNNLINRKR